MNYKIIAVLLLSISNCFAMENPVNNKIDTQTEDLIDYQKYAQKIYDLFAGEERDLLVKLSEIVPQKENEKRYELIAKCLEEIWKYRLQSEDDFIFLALASDLLDFHNTFHMDFDEKNPLVKDVLERISYVIDDISGDCVSDDE